MARYACSENVRPEVYGLEMESTNGHEKYAASNDEIRYARFPDGTTSHSTRLPANVNQVAGYHPIPLDKTTSHSTKLQKTAAKSLVIPEGEGDKGSLCEFHDIVLQKPLLSTQQQLALMNLVRGDDPDAKQRVIAHNLRLVVNIAKRYSDHGVTLLDLVREGTMGLIHALENFELEGGFRFAAYAARCVRQSIERAIMSQSNHLSMAASRFTPSRVSDVSF